MTKDSFYLFIYLLFCLPGSHRGACLPALAGWQELRLLPACLDWLAGVMAPACLPWLAGWSCAPCLSALFALAGLSPLLVEEEEALGSAPYMGYPCHCAQTGG